MRTFLALGAVLSCVVLSTTAMAQSKSADRADRAWKRARYAVIVGDMRDASSFRGSNLAPQLAEGVARRLRGMERVVVLHARDATNAMLDRINRHQLPTLRVDGRVTSVKRGELDGKPSVRCQVSLLVRDEHGGSLRSILKGAATFAEIPRGPQPRVRHMVNHALERAVASALRDASDVMAGAARRAEVPTRRVRRLAFHKR